MYYRKNYLLRDCKSIMVVSVKGVFCKLYEGIVPLLEGSMFLG